MVLPVNGSTHLIPALLLIYRPRKDERLSWLTCSGWFTHISTAAGRAQDRESSPVRDRRSTTVPRHQLYFIDAYCTLVSINIMYVNPLSALCRTASESWHTVPYWRMPHVIFTLTQCNGWHTQTLLLHLSLGTHTHVEWPFVWDYPGEPAQERWNQSGFYWSKRQWVAVASAWPYASLHLAPDR